MSEVLTSTAPNAAAETEVAALAQTSPAWGDGVRTRPVRGAYVITKERSPSGARRLSATGRAMTAIGITTLLFLVFEFAATGLVQGRMQTELLTTFKQRIPTTTLDAPAAVPAEGSAVAILGIPRLGLEQVVAEGTSPEDLKAGPGHLRASPMPGELGNAVIEGRRTTYGAPFGRLDQLHAGDRIKLTTGQGAVVYTVSTVKRVTPGQADPVTGTSDSRLTLVTSDPAFFASGQLAVVAKLEGAPLDVPKRTQPPLSTSDLGLAGDRLGLALTPVWAGLLIAAVWLTLRLRRRFPDSVMYMLGAPVVLGLALLTFTSLDRLLPGTL